MNNDLPSQKDSFQDIQFEERADYESGFADHFEKYIKPSLSILETERLEKLVVYNKRKKLGTILAILISVPVVVILGYLEQDPLWGIITVFTLVFGWVNIPKLQYRESGKQKLVQPVVKFFGDLNYNQTGSVPEQKIKDSQVLPQFNITESEDYISGKLEALNFNFFELRLLQKHEKSTTQVFNGEIIEIEMLKNFKGQTIILDKASSQKRNNFLSKFFNTKTALEEVKLEDPDFEKTFSVYSTDQIEARYLLTTAFMDRLLNLRNFFQESMTNIHKKSSFKTIVKSLVTKRTTINQPFSINVSFFNNIVLLAINSHYDLFEPKSIHESVFCTQDMHLFLGQMNQYKELIKILKLNQDIGL
jgi:hypothetical protein